MINKYGLVLMACLAVAGCAHVTLKPESVGSDRTATTTRYSTQSQGEAASAIVDDEDYHGKGKVRLNRGQVTAAEAREYIKKLSIMHGGSSAIDGEPKLVSRKQATELFPELSGSGYGEGEKFFVVKIPGNYKLPIPQKGQSSIVETYSTYVIAIRAKDGWLAAEQFLK